MLATSYGIWKWTIFQRQKQHRLNILGAVHNLRIPKQAILTKEQSGKLAAPQSLAEFVRNNLNLNAVAMNVRFTPVAKDADTAHATSFIPRTSQIRSEAADSVTNRLFAVPSKIDLSQEIDVKLDVVLSDPDAQSTTEPTELHAKSASQTQS